MKFVFYGKPIKTLLDFGCWQAMVYTKNCHRLIYFYTYLDFMHHGGNLENIFHLNFVIDDGFYPNLPLCCEIIAHMNDIIIQQIIILILRAL